MSDLPIEVRAAGDGDRPFVASNWLRSYEDSHHTAKARHRPYLTHENRQLGAQLRDAYFTQHTVIVNALIDRSTTLVAHMPGEADTLFGFVCGARHRSGVAVVHYVYVKDTFRKNGVARRLVDELLALVGERERVVCSHTTHRVRPLLERLSWPYVPYPAFVAREGRSAA